MLYSTVPFEALSWAMILNRDFRALGIINQNVSFTSFHLTPIMARMAFVTLLTRISYLPGVLVLDYGLKSTGSKYPLVVMVTPTLEEDARDILTQCGIEMYSINSLVPDSSRHTVADHDARFKDTWTKLRYWNRCFHIILLWSVIRAFGLEGFEVS